MIAFGFVYLKQFLKLVCFFKTDNLPDFSRTLKAILEITCGVYLNFPFLRLNMLLLPPFFSNMHQFTGLK